MYIYYIKNRKYIYIINNKDTGQVKLFYLYKDFYKTPSTKFFIKLFTRIIESFRLKYKDFKYKYNLKNNIVKLLTVCINKNIILNNTTIF